MGVAAKIELLLLAKNKLSPELKSLLGLFKQTKKDGKDSAKSLDAFIKKLEKPVKNDGIKKHTDNLKKNTTETQKATEAEEKLNRARKKKPADSSTAKEVGDKKKLADANEKAAASEEKLNKARKRGSGSRSRDERSDGQKKSSSGGRRRRADGNFEEDLVQSGTGAGILWTAGQGLTSAMSKQEALTDLSTAFYRSSISAAEFNAQMREGEKIADDLGNKLPGTTADYIQMFTTMKQRGIETESILKGAGKSAAYLSVANKEDRLDTGKNMARFGQMFNLQTEQEYMNAADLMSRAKTTYGIDSAELMEAVKDFSGRTGKGLGLDGGKGSEETLRYLSFLRAKTGLEGMTVGNASSSFFSQYLQAKQKKKDPTAELKKLTGVDLQIFDQKGKFLGLENAVKEFSKLKGKLSDEQMVTFGGAIAGEEGSSVFQAMVNNGGQWDAFNKELSESISLQDKSAKNAENLTNKIEALTGSLSNLGAASFSPMIEPLSKLTDGTNSFVGMLTDIAKAKPGIASTTAGIVTLAGAFLTLKGGSGLASRFMGGANGGIIAVGDNATKSAGKVGKLKNSLTSTAGIFKILLLMETIGFTWDQITTLRKTVDEWKTMNRGLDENGKQSFQAYKQTPDNQKNPKAEAKSVLQSLDAGSGQFAKSLDQNRVTWLEWMAQTSAQFVGKDPNLGLFQGARDEQLKATEWQFKNIKYEKDPNGGGLKKVYLAENPWKGNEERYRQLEKMPDSQRYVDGLFKSDIQRVFSEIVGVKNLQNRAQSLNDPNVMTSFRRDVLPTLGLGDIKKQFTEQLLQQAFPQSFAQSNQQLSVQTDQLMQKFAGLVQPTTSLGEQFTNLNTNSTSAATSVGTFANAADTAASRINNVQFTPPTFSPVRIPVYQPQASPFSLFGGGRARGGSMQKGHTYQINEIGQEFFTPAASGSMVSNDVLRKNSSSAQAVSVNFSPTITINSDNPNAEQLKNEIFRELAILKNNLMEELSPRMTAKKVYSEIDREVGRG